MARKGLVMMKTGYGLQRFGLLCAVGLGLVACVSGKPQPTTYTDSVGKVTTIESDRESCERACNADYERCMEQGASYRSTSGVGSDAASFLGASSDCRDTLKKCLPRCKGR